MNLHRSVLFVPGDREAMLEKAARLPADTLCLDLEEAVLPEEKPRARELVRAAAGRLIAAGRTVQVRVNSIDSDFTRDDVAAAVQPGLAGVLLAKTQSAQDVRDVDVMLREQEMANDVRPGSVGLTIAVESAGALLRCQEISLASTRLAAIMLGAEDFTFDMGVRRTREGRELDYARSVIATCARAAGLVALDAPWSDVRDIDGLVADAQRAKTLGFQGKYAIHPNHLAPLHRVFSPPEEEVAEARKVLAAWEEALAKGLGVVPLEGRMVDRPVAERARLVVELAEAIASAGEPPSP